MTFEQKAVDNAAKAVQSEKTAFGNPNADAAETRLQEHLNNIPKKEQLDFVKAVAAKTQEDHKKDLSLPQLTIDGDNTVTFKGRSWSEYGTGKADDLGKLAAKVVFNTPIEALKESTKSK